MPETASNNFYWVNGGGYSASMVDGTEPKPKGKKGKPKAAEVSGKGFPETSEAETLKDKGIIDNTDEILGSLNPDLV